MALARRLSARGVAGLVPQKKGPRRPSKLTQEKIAEIAHLRAEGLSLRAIGTRVGVSHDSVLRALGPRAVRTETSAQSSSGGDLVPPARPQDRNAERDAAHRGLLAEAAPVICEGASLPLLGALVILPGLSATGLIEVAGAIYGSGRRVGGKARSAFYGLRSLILCVVFSCLLGEPRAEGLTRLEPMAIGRLIGLDRAPEVSRLRFRLAELSAEHKADELLMSLARRHCERRPEAVGLLYVDGHVGAYHGKAEAPKAHVARMRIAMPAEVDTWVCDRFGDGLLVWQSRPGASLVGELDVVTQKVRELLGPDARPTTCFDRGGWSPKLLAELDKAGVDILTYRKAPLSREPRRAFSSHSFIDELGRAHDYLLADRRVAIAYDAKRRRFWWRQITRLDEASTHQTQVLTTRKDPDPAPVAFAMFSRWREKNFFRYQRAHFALDALDAYATQPDDAQRLVANSAEKDADRSVRETRGLIATAEPAEGRSSIEGTKTTPELVNAFAEARAELEAREASARSIPAKVPLGTVRPAAMRLNVERERVMDAIRMATYNAESALARLIAPHYARAEDEARSLLREIYSSSADLEIEGTNLHVIMNPLSAPRRTRALAALCKELTATETLYPGTELTLVYSAKET